MVNLSLFLSISYIDTMKYDHTPSFPTSFSPIVPSTDHPPNFMSFISYKYIQLVLFVDGRKLKTVVATTCADKINPVQIAA